jgi:hypothetical protein
VSDSERCNQLCTAISDVATVPSGTTPSSSARFASAAHAAAALLGVVTAVSGHHFPLSSSLASLSVSLSASLRSRPSRATSPLREAHSLSTSSANNALLALAMDSTNFCVVRCLSRRRARASSSLESLDRASSRVRTGASSTAGASARAPRAALRRERDIAATSQPAARSGARRGAASSASDEFGPLIDTHDTYNHKTTKRSTRA